MLIWYTLCTHEYIFYKNTNRSMKIKIDSSQFISTSKEKIYIYVNVVK